MESSSQETRAHLLQAALVCFAECGFDGTSMRTIADRAKRPLSLLAHHFGNKEGLYVEVFKLMLARKECRQPAGPEREEDWSPRNQTEAVRVLRELVHQMYGDVQTEPVDEQEDLMQTYGTRLWMHEMHSTRPELYPVLQQYLGPSVTAWRKVIKCLRPELTDPEVAHLGISLIGMVAAHGLLSGINHALWGEQRPLKQPFQASELLVDLCLNGLLGDRP